MKEFLVPKKTGGFRKIYAPSKDEKKLLRTMLLDLELKARDLDTHRVIHGFMLLRSPVTNAYQHVGYNFSACFDLEDFFDSVTESHVNKHMSVHDISLTFIDGAPRQGLPTSPAVANIAASEMDEKIWQLCRDAESICFPATTDSSGSIIPGEKIAYTRYADDLTFSCMTKECVTFLLHEIPKIVRKCKFKINPRKTHVLDGKMGRRIITGVAVGHHGVHATRKIKRSIQAVEHQLKFCKTPKEHKKKLEILTGLKEWARNRLPNLGRKVKAARSQTQLARKKAIKNTNMTTVKRHAQTKARQELMEQKVLGFK